MGSKNRRDLVVLLAEDDLDLLELLSFQLEPRFEVYAASNGQDAIDQIGVLSRIDVLVTDFQMPKTDGLVVATAFRSRFPEGRIILITATPMTDGGILEVLKIPNVEMLKKPFLFDDLERAIRGSERSSVASS